MGKFTFNGKSSESLGLVIQTPPTYTFPDRDMTSSHVPGRNGDLYIDNNCYKNVERAYSLAKGYAAGSSYIDNAEEILSWLTSAKGKYVKLTDTYDPLVYRLALFNMSGSFTDIWNGALTIPVSFICKPQRFLISGDTPVTTSGATAEIENEYGYPSKPIISVSGLSTAISNVDDILILSVYNDNDDIVSSISITKPSGDQSMYNILQIDSENETCIDGNQNDVSYYVGLNGKPFPYLDSGDNTIEVAKYTIDIYSGTTEETGHYIPTYTKLLNDALAETDGIVTSAYKPKDVLIEAQQTKVKVRSYESLINSLLERYPANSVQSLAMEQAKSYTVQSFNDLMNQYGQSFTFTGTIGENSAWPDWLNPVGNPDDSTYELYVPADDSLVDEEYKCGYYLVKSKDKKLKYKGPGTKITDVNASSIITIYFYPAKLSLTYTVDSSVVDAASFNTQKDIHGLYIYQTQFYADTNVVDAETFAEEMYIHGSLYKYVNGNYILVNVYDSTISEYYYGISSYNRVYNYIDDISTYYYVSYRTPNYNLDIGYSDMPSWLKLEIEYETSDDHSPKSISFVVNDVGYYWKDKDKLFGKAKWEKYDTTGIGTALNTLSWNNSKLAFVSTNGLTTSTTTAYTYYHIYNMPEYEDITAVSTNEDGERITTIVAKVHFTVQDISSIPQNYSRVSIFTKEAGYYAYQVNGDGKLNWRQKNAGEQIISINGTDSFDIYYLENEPTYANEEGWPTDIIDPTPIKRGGDSFRPEQITFKVLVAAKYRYSLNEDGSLWSEWQNRAANTQITFSQSDIKDYQDQFYLAKINVEPEELDFDRMYLDAEGEQIEKPSWLNVKCYADKTLQTELTAAEYRALEDKTGVVLRYTTGTTTDQGYYKWDNNDIWMYKEGANIDLLVSNYADETLFYYLHELPEYDNYDHFAVSVSTDTIGNPSLITFTTTTRGYYRVNNGSDWKDYKVGDILAQAKVGENTTIRYLDPTDETLANLAITITPRWWML